MRLVEPVERSVGPLDEVVVRELAISHGLAGDSPSCPASSEMTEPARPRRAIESILLPTDFSEGAVRAASRAVHLPLAPGAKLTFLHCLLAGRSAELFAHAEQQSLRFLERQVTTTKEAARAAGHPEVVVSGEVAVGQPFVEIIRRARLAGAELIVMGRRGEGRRRTALGSTTQRVIRKGDIPVLAVRREASKPYRRVLAAVDLSDTSMRVLELGQKLVDKAQALQMVHAYHVPFEEFLPKGDHREAVEQEAMSGCRHLLETAGAEEANWQILLLEGDPRLVILGQARKQRIELITLGTHGRGGLSHLLLGSVAEWVLDMAPCDVAVTRPARFSFELP